MPAGHLAAHGDQDVKLDVQTSFVKDFGVQQARREQSRSQPYADAERGKGMEGFGASAYTLGGRLIVSTYNGNVQVLETADGEWKIAARLQDDRFFHRMLPYDSRLLLVGGASMRSGKRLHFEMVELSSLK